MEDFIFGDLNSNTSRFERVKASLGGVTHEQDRTPLAPNSTDIVTLRLTVGPNYSGGSAWLYYTTDGTDPIEKQGAFHNEVRLEMTAEKVEWETLVWGYVKHYSIKIHALPAGTVVRYRMSYKKNGSGEIFADDGKYFAYFVCDDPAPEWSKDAVIYQIFTDRFYSEDPTFPTIEPKPSLKCNGTLKGITSKLDYLQDLGINTLWLTPVFPSPSYHHYDATSFTDIDPRLGTKADFKELLTEAKERGIRFIMDLVPNHWSSQHETFQSAITDPKSPYREWYTFYEWPEKYEMFFSVKGLPQINLRNPEARKHVIDAAAYWLEFGVDGFRVDYCIGPTPDFFADLRKRALEVKPECWIFGEAIDSPEIQRSFYGNMNGALDFMLLDAFRKTFATNEWNFEKFSEFLSNLQEFFPNGFTRPSFLDNHDMNRFLWLAKGDKSKLKMAAMCQFLLRQAPIIYYGTEVGLSQERDMLQNGRAIHEEGRLPMLWGIEQDPELLNFYKQLIAFRHNYGFLMNGDFIISVWQDINLHVEYDSEKGRIIGLFNNSNADWSHSFEIDDLEETYGTYDIQWVHGIDPWDVEIIVPPNNAAIIVVKYFVA